MPGRRARPVRTLYRSKLTIGSDYALLLRLYFRGEMASEAHGNITSGTTLNAAELVVRPIAPEDKRGLVAGFERLGDESRYRRFLSPHDRLSEAELRYLTEVDHHDHEALVAIDPRTGQGIAVARYVRSRQNPRAAELAVAVADDWQYHGVGTSLASALAKRAREEGITAFTAMVLAENEPMLNLAGELGEVRILHREHGTVELAIALPEQGPGRLTRLLRAAASGELRPFPLRRLPDADQHPDPL
jgi:RimJ/RimL family protein N-acetyltransferase